MGRGQLYRGGELALGCISRPQAGSALRRPRSALTWSHMLPQWPQAQARLTGVQDGPLLGKDRCLGRHCQQPILSTCDFVSPCPWAFSEWSEQEALLFSDPGLHGNSCGITAWAGVHFGGTCDSSAPEGTWAPAQGHTRRSLQASL